MCAFYILTKLQVKAKLAKQAFQHFSSNVCFASQFCNKQKHSNEAEYRLCNTMQSSK